MMEEGVDLYGDLYDDAGDGLQLLKPYFNQFDARHEEFIKQEAELQCKVEELKKENEVLQQDKAVLVRNISCLFKTAQMELARKDKQMKELRDENLRLKLVGTRSFTNPRQFDSKSEASETRTGKDINGQAKTTNEKDQHTSGSLQPTRRQYPVETTIHKDRESQYERGLGVGKSSPNLVPELKARASLEEMAEIIPHDQILVKGQSHPEVPREVHHSGHDRNPSVSHRLYSASEENGGSGHVKHTEVGRPDQSHESWQGRAEDLKDSRQRSFQKVSSHDMEGGRPCLENGPDWSLTDRGKCRSPSRDEVRCSGRTRDGRNLQGLDDEKKLGSPDRSRVNCTVRSRESRHDRDLRDSVDRKRQRSLSRDRDNGSDRHTRLEERRDRYPESSRRSRNMNDTDRREYSREREENKGTRQHRK